MLLQADNGLVTPLRLISLTGCPLEEHMLFRRLPAANRQVPVQSGHWFDYDPLALVVLILGIGGVAIIAFTI
jgi:hypothetical protein